MAAMTRQRVDLPDLVTREKYDAVLFDLDGVLTSTAAIHAEAWKQMFDCYLADRAAAEGPARRRDERLRPFDIVSDYRKYIDGKPRYDGVRSFLESRGIRLPEGTPGEPPGDATVCALGNRKDAMVKEAIAAGRVETFEGSVRWVRQLRDAGFKTAVVSSSRNCGAVLRAAKIDHLFDARVDGQTLLDLGLPGKPAPESFLKAAEFLDVSPRRSVVVEDAISGVQSAKAGGVGLIIGVDREGHADALRHHGAEVIVADVGELAK